jgi:Ca-activated chloride channel homolog
MIERLPFLHPAVLLSILLIAPLFLLLRKAEKGRTSRAKLLGLKAEYRHGRPFLISTFITFLIVVLARPYWGFEDVKVPGSNRDFALIVDVSRSMLAKDVPPSRMQFTRHKVQDFIEQIREHSPGDRIGIILFAGESYLFCPLTADYAVAKVFADAISPDLITAPGSALADAVQTALTSFKETEATYPRLVLISDGEDNQLNTDAVIGNLKNASIPLYVVGVGTPEGAPIDEGRGIYLKDKQGNIVVSKLNEESLRALAENTGGRYFRARIDSGDVKEIFDSTSVPLSSNSRQLHTIRVYHELGPVLLWIPLVGIVLLLLMRKPELLFSLGGLCLLLGRDAAADSSAVARDAYVAYLSGDYETALQGFKSAYEGGEKSARTLQALGSSYYKTGKFAEASKYFSELLSEAKSGREKFEAHYDLGNSKLMEKKYDDAIHNYEDALKLKPHDKPTEYNLELAKKLKQEEEQKKNEEKKKDEKKPEDKKDQDQKKQDQKQEEKPEERKDQEKDSQKNDDEKQNSEEQQKKDENKEKEQSKEETPSPSPAPTDSDSEKQNEEGASPSPSPSPTLSDGGSAEGAQTAEPTPGEEQALKAEEAKEWLESLPDAPVLLRRKVGKRRSDIEQTW